MMAASNVVSYGGMLLAAAFVPICTTVLGLSIQETFLALGILAVGLAWWVVATLPDALVRAVNFLLTNLVYRVEVRGGEKLPLEGGALLCCNHVSYVDASLILSITKRPVRFLMYRKIYEIPVIHQVARAAGAIPVMAGESKDKVAESLSAATDAIRSGELVCLFPEGGITRDGELKPFRKGLERIMAPVDAPIYPVALLRLWGSIFSFSRRPVLRFPERFPYPVEIVIGDPLPHTATAEEVRLAVARLMEPSSDSSSAN
jgi:1-acyl-sn-glycerol-3-phosphate acyltransferase